MFCVIQELNIKKVPVGEAKEIEAHETTWTDSNGEKGSIWGWNYSKEHFERPVRKAYRISIHKSYRESRKVKKKQIVICTIGYYEILDWGSWVGDYLTSSCWKDKIDAIGLSEDEVVDMIYKKFQPIVDQVMAEFQQTEEYRAKEEHKRILNEHWERVSAFKKKYDSSESEYNHCYDIFGKLRNPEALKRVKAEYKARKDYERQSWKQSSGYYEKFFNNYGSRTGGSYCGNNSNTYGKEDQILLKKFYRTLSKVYHPDSNPGIDTSAEMKLLNQIKADWGL